MGSHSLSRVITVSPFGYLDVEGVALGQLLLVASVFKADAPPAGADQSGFRGVVIHTFHAQVRVVICQHSNAEKGRGGREKKKNHKPHNEYGRH